MLKSTSLKALVTLVMVSFILMASSPKATEARYLMTRSDPLLSPIGPPYGKDPRFDRLYDIITKVRFFELCTYKKDNFNFSM
jgi:hypothetical protein